MPDVHVDDVLVPEPSWAPHGLDELPSRQRRPRPRCHDGQQVELRPRHLGEAAVDVEGPGCRINGQPAHLDPRSRQAVREGGPRPAQHGPNPCDELSWRERLDQIIVRPH